MAALVEELQRAAQQVLEQVVKVMLVVLLPQMVVVAEAVRVLLDWLVVQVAVVQAAQVLLQVLVAHKFNMQVAVAVAARMQDMQIPQVVWESMAIMVVGNLKMHNQHLQTLVVVVAVQAI
jgi:hypothetical protein